jgi:hypothetical protein
MNFCLYHDIKNIGNRTSKEQGKGIIKKTTESKDKAKSRKHTRKQQKGGVHKNNRA